MLLNISTLTIFTNGVGTQQVKRQSFWFVFRRAFIVEMHGVSAISKQILITVSNSFPAWRSSSWALQDSIQHTLKVDGHTNGHNVKCSSNFYTYVREYQRCRIQFNVPWKLMVTQTIIKLRAHQLFKLKLEGTSAARFNSMLLESW